MNKTCSVRPLPLQAWEVAQVPLEAQSGAGASVGQGEKEDGSLVLLGKPRAGVDPTSMKTVYTECSTKFLL